MNNLAPCLWFNGQAEEAAQFYVSLFKDSAIDLVLRNGEGMRFPAGSALMVEFTIKGQRVQALNGGPEFTFNEAISLSVECEDQAEIDHLWNSLCADGGAPMQCAWLKDKYGVAWQIVPKFWAEVMRSTDFAAQQRAMQAMMTMDKLIIADLEAAFRGD